MIDRIIDFSVRNKFIVFALVAVGCVAGWWSMKHMTLDAIPDLGDTQVIIFSRWDRSPDIIEDQVTYPIVSTLVGAPKVKAVRGFSDFGYSYVYVIFEDGTDIYWARSRTQEYLSSVLPRLPAGVKSEIGPDATPLGWVFQYALVDESGKHSLAELRSYQDFYLKYYLREVPGVAEVAPVGGFGKQYQVNVDPNRLQAYGLSINRVVEAVRGGNYESAGRLIEFGGTEYNVRGRGYIKSVKDLEDIAVSVSDSGTPIRLKDIGQVTIGPDLRRGVADLDGKGDVVSGIVIMRHGQNALDVIERVKAKLHEIEPGLPPGVKVVPVYDRSDLILRSIDNLKTTVVEVLITVSLVVLLFLWHVPSALIPLITIPVVILLSFIPFRMMGITANIMSLCGIAIAIGAMVDASIVVVEQAHKNLEQWEKNGRREDYRSVVIRAVKQVAGPSFFALLVIAVSFLPILTLEAQEGRLFKPLAYTKNLAMIIAAVLAITLDPALRLLLIRMKDFSFRAPVAVPDRQHPFCGHHPLGGKAPRQPLPDADLRSRPDLVPSLEMGGHRGRPWPDDHHGPGLSQAGIGIHAAAGGGVHPLHAHHHAGHLHCRGPEGAPGHGPDHQAVPRGGVRAGEGGQGRDLDRPGAAFHAGDRDHPQAQIGVAESGHLVLLVGAGVGEGPAAPCHPGSHLPGRAHRPDERGPEDYRPVQLVDHAHQGAVRHVEHRASHAGGAQDHRRGPRRHRGDRGPDRIPAALRRGDEGRLCRADRRRLFHRYRVEPGSACPLRPEHAGGPGRGGERHRRRQRDHHGGRAGALPGERAVQARLPVRPGRVEAGAGPCFRGAETDPPQPPGGHPDEKRSLHDPKREWPSHRLRVRGRRRPRPERLHRGGGPPVEERAEAFPRVTPLPGAATTRPRSGSRNG